MPHRISMLLPRTPAALRFVCFIAATLICTAAATEPACAQSTQAIPKLDLARFTQPWYEIERLPNKREKRCTADDMVLYGLNDNKNTFQIVLSCLIKSDLWDYWNLSGKLDPSGTGELETTRLWIFHSKYWVLAAAPDMQWMLVGTPNHKSLRVLARTPSLAPDVLSRVEAQARSQGFDTASLIHVAQRGGKMNPGAAQHPATGKPQAAPPPGL